MYTIRAFFQNQGNFFNFEKRARETPPLLSPLVAPTDFEGKKAFEENFVMNFWT